ncbi:M48 family metalloprotease [Nocardiopsis sp. CC223A]|uniref:M48 family metalloprotease n=1 Tax=Nocardiopsis sp. CC223A TaxID=3044051 RepID=UPI00278C646C|nr:M48 family metalloprotease [Nocardiopsis sp. CC223A]
MTLQAAAAFCDECGTPLAGATLCPACATPVTFPPDPRSRSRYRDRAARASRRTGRQLRAVLRHNRAGGLVGAIAAWFNLPLVLLMAAVGGVFGGIVGLFSGGMGGPGALTRVSTLWSVLVPMPVDLSDLLPTAAIQIGGVIGALVGIAAGALTMAWLTLATPWELLYTADPLWPLAVLLGQLLTAAAVGALYTTYSIHTEAWRLRLAGARRLSRREAAWLLPLLRQAAQRMGIPADDLPVLLMDDRHTPNATAFTRHIVIDQGLLEFLRHDTETVEAVLAHELAHWHRGDATVMAWGKGLALPLYLAYNFTVKVHEATRWGPLRILVWIVLWSVNATMHGLVVPLHARYWRDCEYAADAAAAAAGYADGLHRALSRLRQTFDGARTGWDATMLATHPPTELRLERLERPGREHPLPGALSAARTIPRPDLPHHVPDKD